MVRPAINGTISIRQSPFNLRDSAARAAVDTSNESSCQVR